MPLDLPDADLLHYLDAVVETGVLVRLDAADLLVGRQYRFGYPPQPLVGQRGRLTVGGKQPLFKRL